jgi:hypothetical protein
MAVTTISKENIGILLKMQTEMLGMGVSSGNQGQARSQRIWAQFEAQKRGNTQV